MKLGCFARRHARRHHKDARRIMCDIDGSIRKARRTLLPEVVKLLRDVAWVAGPESASEARDYAANEMHHVLRLAVARSSVLRDPAEARLRQLCHATTDELLQERTARLAQRSAASTPESRLGGPCI